MVAPSIVLKRAAKPASPKNSLSVASIGRSATNFRTSHAPVSACTVFAQKKLRVTGNFVPCKRSKTRFAASAVSASHGQLRVGFNSSAARYKPAGSQKVMKGLPRTDK